MRLDHLTKDQRTTAARVVVTACRRQVSTIAGADVARKGDYLFAWVGVFSFPSLQLLDSGCARSREIMPYVPGFLSYRELPVLIKAFMRTKLKPDVILVDGQGIAHPRRLGLASHLGVVLDLPTIGCAKSHLFGQYDMPGVKRGLHTVMKNGDEKIGIVLRTRDNVKPLFVSPGHLVSSGDCLSVVLAATTRYRIPEPIRYAHKMARLKAQQISSGGA